jgi:ATP-dependent Lon protease
MEKTQREYYLNEQMKAIQRELGDGEDGQNEIAELEERDPQDQVSKEAREKAEAELKKLKSMSPMSAEATVCATTSTGCCRIPWGVKSRVKKDLRAAQGCSTPITMAWRRSRSGSSNTSPCRRARRS